MSNKVKKEKLLKYGEDHHAGVGFYYYNNDILILVFRNEYDCYYVYDHEKPGGVHLKKMKALAKAGKDLTTYVNKHVRGNYKDKLTMTQLVKLYNVAF